MGLASTCLWEPYDTFRPHNLLLASTACLHFAAHQHICITRYFCLPASVVSLDRTAKRREELGWEASASTAEAVHGVLPASDDLVPNGHDPSFLSVVSRPDVLYGLLPFVNVHTRPQWHPLSFSSLFPLSLLLLLSRLSRTPSASPTSTFVPRATMEIVELTSWTHGQLWQGNCTLPHL